MPDDGNEPMHETILDHHPVGRPLGGYPNKPGTKYLVSAYVNVAGGTISMRAYGDLSASQRVSYALTASLAGPMSMYYSVKSGNPTVTVTNILICTWDEYQANKTLLDGIGYFTGNTMPLA